MPLNRLLIDLSTRAKLAFGFLSIAAVFSAALVVIWVNVAAAQRLERTVAVLLDLSANMNAQRSALLSALLTEDATARERLLRDSSEAGALSTETLRKVAADADLDAQLSGRMKSLEEMGAALTRSRNEEIAPRIRASQNDLAKELLTGGLGARYQAFRSLVQEIQQQLDTAAERRLARSAFGLIGAAIGAVILSLLLVSALDRLLAGPLNALTRAAERLAAGDLSAALETTPRNDEVGRLQESFRRMRRALRTLAERAKQIAAGDLTAMVEPQSADDALGAAFAMMAKNLRTLIREMVEAAAVLAQANSELSAAAAQMATSATETAAAVNETTATVEEVKHAAGTSSETARRFSDQSQHVAQVSVEGKHSVEQLIAGMAHVREHMDSVANSILSLNAQGQTIGGIIATVDDLAVQSKMLAINASIEAAKAGDEGKGFAIVAQHVKSLAEQSRQATNRVRTILTEIERATNSAVLTTEQGSKSVENGVRQSQAASETIAALADGVAHAAQATTQIAVASHEQFVGMDQVARAMENIKEACAKNAEGARQAESTAKRLATLGTKFQRLAGNFKV